MDYMENEDNGKLDLVPLTRCFYCLSEDHVFDGCPVKHDCFRLNYNDEKVLESIAVFYPRWTSEGFVADPHKPPFKPRR